MARRHAHYLSAAVRKLIPVGLSEAYLFSSCIPIDWLLYGTSGLIEYLLGHSS